MLWFGNKGKIERLDHFAVFALLIGLCVIGYSIEPIYLFVAVGLYPIALEGGVSE